MTARKKAAKAAGVKDANGSVTVQSAQDGPATKKIYTRTYYYLVDDKRAPGGKKLAIIALDYESNEEKTAANELTAHMELGRKFPDLKAGSIRHVYSEETARVEAVTDG